MICARLHLQERSKPKVKLESCTNTDKPRRYCQKRLINPDHDEDPRWTDVFERFHCNVNETNSNLNETLESVRVNQDVEDIFLSVQTLKFQGDIEQNKKTKSNFKYRTGGINHRMFVKQVVPENDCDDDRSSQLTCYYFDDYVKYLSSNADKSRPTSVKSSIFHQGLKDKNENETVHIDVEKIGNGIKKTRKVESKVKSFFKKCVKQDIKDEIKKDESNIEDTKITFHKSGKRKCLTISRTQSPETVQVIRVDIVCNYSCSSVMSDDENKNLDSKPSDTTAMEIGKLNMRSSHFSNKYLLTSTVKTLDENLPGGSKVTLLCKTFKLTDRFKSNKCKSLGNDKKCTKVL